MGNELAGYLKRICVGCEENGKPADTLNATVTEIRDGEPIIQLDSAEEPLVGAALVVPETFKSFTVQVSGTFHGEDHSGALTIDNSLKEGDRIYVTRKRGGQKFIVLGRV